MRQATITPRNNTHQNERLPPPPPPDAEGEDGGGVTGTAVTVVVIEVELFAADGSTAEVETVVFETAVPAVAALPETVIVAMLAAAISPSVHVTLEVVTVQLPTVAFAEVAVRPVPS